MKIYYCENCGQRVPDEDLDSGKAFVEAGETAFCAGCVVALQKPKPLSKRPPTRGNVLPGRSQRNATQNSGRPKTNSFSTQPLPQTHAQNTEHHPPTGSPSNRHPAAASKPNYLPHLALGALAVGVLFGVSLLFRGNKPVEAPSKPVVQTPPVTPQTNITPTTQTQVDPPKDPPKTGGMLGAMMEEHNRQSSPESVNAQALARLNSAKEFNKLNPQDPWTFLEKLRAVPDRTAPGNEAAAAIAALKVPVEKSGTPGWYRDWDFPGSTGSQTEIQYMFDGRKDVLKITPLAGQTELPGSRKFNIPQSATVFECAVKGAEKVEGSFVVEFDGKLQALAPLKGGEWKNVSINIKPIAGKIVEVKIREVAGKIGDSIYVTEPRFVDAPTAGVTQTAYNPNAGPYSPSASAVAARAAKRPFVGPMEWVQPTRFKTSINLLALVDVKSGSIDSDWKVQNNGAILSGKNKTKAGARLDINFNCPVEYDVKAVFERKVGEGDMVMILSHPSSGKQFVFSYGAMTNRYAAITDAGGLRFENSPAAVLIGKCIETNRPKPYTAVVEVRKNRVSAYIDGRIVTEWTSDMGALSLNDNWKLKSPTHIGLGSWASEVLYHSFELSEVK